MPTIDKRERENARYFLHGHLVTDTALHIGSGYGNAATDAAVVRDLWGRPYIPGSSFKGVLRSTIERTIATVQNCSIVTCQLTPGYSGCLTTDAKRQEAYSREQERFPAHQDERQLINFLIGAQGICDVCWLFGSPFSQSRVYVTDLPLDADAAGGATQSLTEPQPGELRHGVGIDRETLTARDRIKFDYEALPAQLTFAVELIIDRPSPLDWALLALGLQEMRLGYVAFGGIRSRGLGRATLTVQTLRRMDLSDKAALIDFLCQTEAVQAGDSQQALPPGAMDPAATILAHLQQLRVWL